MTAAVNRRRFLVAMAPILLGLVQVALAPAKEQCGIVLVAARRVTVGTGELAAGSRQLAAGGTCRLPTAGCRLASASIAAVPSAGELHGAELTSAEAIAGTWVLQQVTSQAELDRFLPKTIGPALKTPHIRASRCVCRGEQSIRTSVFWRPDGRSPATSKCLTRSDSWQEGIPLPESSTGDVGST